MEHISHVLSLKHEALSPTPERKVLKNKLERIWPSICLLISMTMGHTALKRILVADDHEIIRRFVVSALERNGYETRVAADGKEAVSIFRECPDDFDLVLTDLAMPRINGLELARAVRSLRPETPIILMSGSFGRQNLDHFPLLQKPFNTENLLEEVHRQLSFSPTPQRISVQSARGAHR